MRKCVFFFCDRKVSLSACYRSGGGRICVGETREVSDTEIPRRICASCIVRPQHAWRNRTETSQPHGALRSTWLHLSMPYTAAVFIFLLQSCCLLCALFAFSCTAKISTLSGGCLMVLSKLSLFCFFLSVASCDSSLFFCRCHMPPFFLCISLFSALCRFLFHRVWQSALMTQQPLICF